MIVWIGLLALTPSLVSAQEPTGGSEANAQLEKELAAVRADLAKAFDTADLELLLSYCHPEVVATWQDGQVAVGHDGVRRVINQTLQSDNRIIQSYRTDPVVETRIVLNDGQTVVSRGKFNDEYTLTHPRGSVVRLNSIWTITLVKVDGRWLIAGFHVSANAFDNEAISLFRNITKYSWGGGGVVLGLVFGSLLGLAIGRRRSRKTGSSMPSTRE